MSYSRKSLRFCRFHLFLCFVNITFKGLRPATTIYEVGNASKNGSAATLSLGYIVAVLIFLSYSVRFLLLNNVSFEAHMHLY